LAPQDLKHALEVAGFGAVDIRYTGFFPKVLSAFRKLEPWLSRAPFGAQYCAVAGLGTV
jgi:hypothetical protein